MRGSLLIGIGFLGLLSAGKTIAQTATALPADDAATSLFATSAWHDGKLPGTWITLPSEPQRQGREMKPMTKLLGVMPQRVIAWFDHGKLSRIDVLVAQGAGSAIAAAETTMVQALQTFSGQSGQAATVPPPGKAWDFTSPTTQFRLAIEPGKRLTLAALPSSASQADPTVVAGQPASGSKPGKKYEDNVEKSENGDAIIRHLPAPPMEGDAAYIGLYHVLMLQSLYGWPGDYTKLLRDMGWTPGNDTFDWYKYYPAVAKQAKTRMEPLTPFNFDEVAREILRGHPVIVWDATEDVRNKYHVDFAAKFKADPKLELPSARDAEEKKKWPHYQSESNAGAMMIVGVNKRRGEIIFSRQDMGAEYTELRMRKEEIAFTAGSVFIFHP